MTVESTPHDFEENRDPDSERRGRPTCVVCGTVESDPVHIR